jgi:diaminohydroxyphosphoribosylaminopyrimidine deaminase/5-amino-6-(5-phosphoribosylamino)uracil reductase
MKAAMTIDGQLAAADGSSQWITSPQARRDAHETRSGVDAVMVGAGTVLADNPALTVRLDGYTRTQPSPVVVAGSRALDPGAAVFSRDPVVLAPANLDLPGDVVVVPDGAGRVDLPSGLEALGDRGIGRVLVEGGATLLTSLLESDLIDEGVVYYGSKLAGGVGRPLFDATWDTLGDARTVEIIDARLVGGDVRVHFVFPGR